MVFREIFVLCSLNHMKHQILCVAAHVALGCTLFRNIFPVSEFERLFKRMLIEINEGNNKEII